MKILVLVLIIAFVWLLISYVGVLVRLHRIGGELEAIKKYLVEIVLENNDRNNVFQKILEYIGASSQCITDIANEIEKNHRKDSLDGWYRHNYWQFIKY